MLTAGYSSTMRENDASDALQADTPTKLLNRNRK